MTFAVFESSCHLPICLPHTVEALHCYTSSRKAVKTKFYSLLFFYVTRNRTESTVSVPNAFSNRRLIGQFSSHKNETVTSENKLWLNKISFQIKFPSYLDREMKGYLWVTWLLFLPTRSIPQHEKTRCLQIVVFQPLH